MDGDGVICFVISKQEKQEGPTKRHDQTTGNETLLVKFQQQDFNSILLQLFNLNHMLINWLQHQVVSINSSNLMLFTDCLRLIFQSRI